MATTTTRDLAQAGEQTGDWTFEGDGFAAVKPALRRIYRRGRTRVRAAHAEPTAENLHAAASA